MGKAFFITILLIALPACSDGNSWSDPEKQNAQFVWMAFREAQAAIKVSNSVGSDPDGAYLMSSGDIDRMRLHYDRAYDLARQVEDAVLDKINRELRTHWRSEFQEGVRLRLRNLTLGDALAELKGSTLLDEFGDWWNANKKRIRIPAL